MVEQNNDLKLEEKISQYRKSIRIEATLLIATVLGACALNGYAHLEKYYLTLDVPIDRLNFSPQKIAIYGGAGLGSVISAVLFSIALVATMTLILALFEKPGKQPSSPLILPGWINRFLQRASELSSPIKMVVGFFAIASFFLIAWYLMVTVPSGSGKDAALKTAADCRESTLTFSNLTKYEACQVAESNDMFYLLKRTVKDDKKVSFYTYQVPKKGFVKSQRQEKTLEFEK